ncbi:glutaminase A [Cytophaga aurantiaca]|uniref:glutaminase A n=1 Tax=Cytophaga aurantiaca TaxID=29530 RepID=UPI0003621F75|nr:glutaminase A [Cytophaga aurantiaca]
MKIFSQKNRFRTITVASMLLIGAIVTAFTFSKPVAATDPINNAIKEAYAKFKDLKEGKNADYIPALAEVNSNLYGIAIVTVDGKVYKIGDVDSLFSIQSISKVFTLARVIEDDGAQSIQDKIGVDATGLKFNSIVAIEERKGKEINSFVNPGAIATTSLVRGATYDEKWNRIIQTHSDFANRSLGVNGPVYKSEAETNQRNQAIAMLMHAYGEMYFDPLKSTDIYTKQCAINVGAYDLAVMAGTLANGGKNPLSKKVVVSPITTQHVLAVMSTAGLYDDSGIWLYNAGAPAKSGVGGGIIAVIPGKFGIAVFSPPLDAAGNSVKAQKTIQYIIQTLGANPYLIQPK